MDDRVRNALVTYQQFASPIKTNNIFHVSNSYNLFNITAIYSTGGLAGGICLGIVAVQFILIKKYHWYDWLVLCFIIFAILLDGILFMRFVWNTDKACDMAFYMANENLEVRKGISKEKRLYWWASPFLEFLSYLLYPRKESLIKALLTVGGFITACIVGGKFYISHLVYILIVFELFLYQARYQLNDLRGLDEDKNYTQKKLVNYVDEAKPVRVVAALGFAVVRIVLAIVFVLCLGGSIRSELLWCMLSLLVVTVLYEGARRGSNGVGTIVLSGAGFPIRFIVGMLAADKDVVLMCWTNYNHILIIVITSILWAWGICTSLLVWVRDIERLVRTGIHNKESLFPKSHYNAIYPFIKDRLTIMNKRSNDDSIVAEKCNNNEPWCVIYWLVILLLSGIWCWYIWYIRSEYGLLSFFKFPALLFAAPVIVNEYDGMITSTKYCLLSSFVTLYICYICNYDMRICLVYNMLLAAIVLSVCILRNRKMDIRIPNPFKYIAIFLIGEKAVQLLKRTKES